MMCRGCYKTAGKEGYCTSCRKQLFKGAKVLPVLPFDAPCIENPGLYQDRTTRLCIPGVQLKYSLQLKGKELQLAEKEGQYILKPAPPVEIGAPIETPENEHLTMQIASQLFGIHTAANALVYFKDGTPAYITRRFDVRADGKKYLQEDMAQISGRSRQAQEAGFTGKGTYEEIGRLINKYVTIKTPAIEQFFRQVLFNYLFSNGEAHFRNFSLILTDKGTYTLAPAYDLMCTALHSMDGANLALALYEGDKENSFYSTYGFYGQPDFIQLAQKIGITTSRAEGIINLLLSHPDKVIVMITNSFLEETETKEKYIEAYQERLKRLKMRR